VCIKGRWSGWSLQRSTQGSVLGPLLFLVFDLDKGITSNILNSADNTKIFKEVRDSIQCESKKDATLHFSITSANVDRF